MRGTVARAIRAKVGNPGETEYQVRPGTKRWKSARVTGPDAGGGVETCTLHLDPACGRKHYRNTKRMYQEMRAAPAQ